MNFYFVSIYNPKGSNKVCFGLFELERFNNEHYLKWHFGHDINQLTAFCSAVNQEVAGELYIIDSLVGETYTCGYPFKPHYFAYCINKSELYEYFSVS